MFRTIIFLGLFFSGGLINAQDKEIENLLEEAKTEWNEGDMFMAMNSYQQAYDKSIIKNNDSIRNLAYNGLYDVYYKMGKNESILNLVESEIELYTNSVEFDPIKEAKLKRRAGYFAYKSGLVVKSLNYYKDAYILGEDTTNVLEYNQYLEYVVLPQSVNFASLGDYKNAIEFQERVLDYLISAKKTTSIALSLNNLGEYYDLDGRSEKAVINFEKVLEYPEYRNFDYATAYLGLAKIYLKKKEMEQARNLFQQSSSFLNKSENDDNVTLQKWLALKVDFLLHRGEFHNLDSKFDMAVKDLNDALKVSKERFEGSRNREFTKIQNLLGNIYLEKQEPLTALAHFQKGLNDLPDGSIDTQKLVARKGLIQSYQQIDFNKRDNRNLSKIIDLTDSAVVDYQKIAQFYVNDEARINLAQYLRESVNIGINACLLGFINTQDQSYALKAASLSDFVHGVALNEAIKKSRIQTEEEFTKNINYLSLNKDKIELTHKIALAKASGKSIGDLKAKLANLELDIQRNQSHLNDSLYSFQSEMGFPEMFAKNLKNEQSACLIFYWDEFNSELYRIFLNQDESSMDKFILQAELIDQIKIFIKNFSFEERHNYDLYFAQYLGRLLIPKMMHDVKDVVIIPDGVLGYLPFEALMYEDGSYLVQNHNINMTQSLSVLNQLNELNYDQMNKRVLAVAPIFEENTSDHLSFSHEEVSSIADNVSTKILLSDMATRSNFIQNSDSYSSLHLSTHAEFDSKNGSAFIRFSHDTLFLEEIYQHKFNNQMIVLSACESGLGELVSAEGVMSLSRAFNYSGIPSVVSTLWKVNEKSSKELSQNFYQEMKLGLPSAEALAQAKRNYLSNPEVTAEAKSPYYWAGFVHWGSDKTLELDEPSHLNLFLVIAAGAILAFLFFWLIGRRKKT